MFTQVVIVPDHFMRQIELIDRGIRRPLSGLPHPMSAGAAWTWSFRG